MCCPSPTVWWRKGAGFLSNPRCCDECSCVSGFTCSPSAGKDGCKLDNLSPATYVTLKRMTGICAWEIERESQRKRGSIIVCLHTDWHFIIKCLRLRIIKSGMYINLNADMIFICKVCNKFCWLLKNVQACTDAVPRWFKALESATQTLGFVTCIWCL